MLLAGLRLTALDAAHGVRPHVCDPSLAARGDGSAGFSPQRAPRQAGGRHTVAQVRLVHALDDERAIRRVRPPHNRAAELRPALSLVQVDQRAALKGQELVHCDGVLAVELEGGLLLELYPEPFAAIQPFARFGRYVCARAYLPIK